MMWVIKVKHGIEGDIDIACIHNIKSLKEAKEKFNKILDSLKAEEGITIEEIIYIPFEKVIYVQLIENKMED